MNMYQSTDESEDKEMKEIVDEIIRHSRIILELEEKLRKEYGVDIYAVRPERKVLVNDAWYENGAYLQGEYGFQELADELGGTIQGKDGHYSFEYDGCNFCTVTNGAKRFKKAKKVA